MPAPGIAGVSAPGRPVKADLGVRPGPPARSQPARGYVHGYVLFRRLRFHSYRKATYLLTEPVSSGTVVGMTPVNVRTCQWPQGCPRPAAPTEGEPSAGGRPRLYCEQVVEGTTHNRANAVTARRRVREGRGPVGDADLVRLHAVADDDSSPEARVASMVERLMDAGELTAEVSDRLTASIADAATFEAVKDRMRRLRHEAEARISDAEAKAASAIARADQEVAAKSRELNRAVQEAADSVAAAQEEAAEADEVAAEALAARRAAEEERDAATARAAAAVEDQTRAEEARDQAEARAEAAEEAFDAAEARAGQLEADRDHAHERAATAEARIVELTGERDGALRRADTAEARLAEASQARDRLNDELTGLRAAVARAEGQLEAAQRQLDDERRTAAERLEQVRGDHGAEIERVRADHRAQVEDLSGRIDRLEARLGTSTAEGRKPKRRTES